MNSDWYQADKSMVDPLYKEYADKYAKEKNIKVRTAPLRHCVPSSLALSA